MLRSAWCPSLTCSGEGTLPSPLIPMASHSHLNLTRLCTSTKHVPCLPAACTLLPLRKTGAALAVDAALRLCLQSASCDEPVLQLA